MGLEGALRKLYVTLLCGWNRLICVAAQNTAQNAALKLLTECDFFCIFAPEFRFVTISVFNDIYYHKGV